MRRNRFHRRAHKFRRRRSFKQSQWWPFFLIFCVVLAALSLFALVAYVALPQASEWLGFSYRAPFLPEPTPAPTPRPTPTPHPITYFNPTENTHEMVFDGYSDYRWFADPYIYQDRMIVSAGQLDENSQDVHLLHLYWYDTQTQSAQRLPISPQNVHFMFPKFNDSWLVYLDANLDGGGAIMAVDLTADTMTPVKVKDIYVGQPEPMLDGNYVAFMDRTGTKKEKLFVFDLSTMESTVVEMFSGTVYGQSKPSLQNGRLLWAEPSSTQGDSDLSCIRYMQLGEVAPQSGIGGNGIYTPGTFVHDPKHSGKYTAWLSDVHSSDTQLYGVVDLMGDPFLIDSGVVDFGIGTDFVAYSRTDASVSPATEAIFLYMFETNSIYRLTQDYESAQLLGVSGDYVIWMDVTSRERDIVKYVKIP